MPNWVFNRLQAKPHVLKECLNADGEVTYSKIVPTPPVLKHLGEIKKGALNSDLFKAYDQYVQTEKTDLFKEYYDKLKYDRPPFEEWVQEQIFSVDPASYVYMKKLFEDYGVTNWYDFNCKYYGCKWDASECGGPFDGTEGEITFQSPWSPPEGFFKALVNKFPNEEILMHSDEESCMFSVNFEAYGDGTYSEVEAPYEYYMPYIPDEDDVVEQFDDVKNPKDLENQITNYLPEDCNIEFTYNDKLHIMTVDVYDWETYGGDLLWSHTFENVKEE